MSSIISVKHCLQLASSAKCRVSQSHICAVPVSFLAGLGSVSDVTVCGVLVTVCGVLSSAQKYVVCF